jgi:hypothetical protein
MKRLHQLIRQADERPVGAPAAAAAGGDDDDDPAAPSSGSKPQGSPVEGPQANASGSGCGVDGDAAAPGNSEVLEVIARGVRGEAQPADVQSINWVTNPHSLSANTFRMPAW